MILKLQTRPITLKSTVLSLYVTCSTRSHSSSFCRNSSMAFRALEAWFSTVQSRYPDPRIEGTTIAEKSESHVGRFFFLGQCIMGRKHFRSSFSVIVFYSQTFLVLIPLDSNFQQRKFLWSSTHQQVKATVCKYPQFFHFAKKHSTQKQSFSMSTTPCVIVHSIGDHCYSQQAK